MLNAHHIAQTYAIAWILRYRWCVRGRFAWHMANARDWLKRLIWFPAFGWLGWRNRDKEWIVSIRYWVRIHDHSKRFDPPTLKLRLDNDNAFYKGYWVNQYAPAADNTALLPAAQNRLMSTKFAQARTLMRNIHKTRHKGRSALDHWPEAAFQAVGWQNDSWDYVEPLWSE